MPIEVQIIRGLADVLARGDVLLTLLPCLASLNTLGRKPVERVVGSWCFVPTMVKSTTGVFKVRQSRRCIFVGTLGEQDLIVEISVSLNRIRALVDA